MNINHQVGQWNHLRGDKMGDHAGDGVCRTAWKRPVHIHAVNWRKPRARRDRWMIQHWDDDDPPANVGRIQLAEEIHQRDWTFVFVTVISSGQDRRRSVSVLHHKDRHEVLGPAGRVRRLWHGEVAGLLSVGVKVDA